MFMFAFVSMKYPQTAEKLLLFFHYKHMHVSVFLFDHETIPH